MKTTPPTHENAYTQNMFNRAYHSPGLSVGEWCFEAKIFFLEKSGGVGEWS